MLYAIDLFSGCGGLSEGLKQAGFNILAGVEINKKAIVAYEANHEDTVVFEKDIRKLSTDEIKKLLNGCDLHLLAGCPPCQGFSSIRRLNKKQPVKDERNTLIKEYFIFIKELKPLTIMMENVPGLINYELFDEIINEIKELGYKISYEVVNVARYGVPQRRRRLVLVGSLLGEINVAEGNYEVVTVRDVIGNIENTEVTRDPVHKIYPKHTKRVQDIINMIPTNGGSRRDLPEKYWLKCHKKEGIGFNDVYGRLKWDDVSSTITGGCLNPSKGRFLHPEENRCISAREAALLQTFPRNYKFPLDRINKTDLAKMIGNALPPKFSYIQAKNIIRHLKKHFN